MSGYFKALDKNTGRLVLFRIIQDCDPENPLDYDDYQKDYHGPLFVLTNHRRYSFGHKDAESIAWDLLRAEPGYDPEWEEDFTEEGEENLDYKGDGLPGLAAIAHALPDCFIEPVYMYEHSGIALSLRSRRSYPFNDAFDSGCLGFVLWTGKEIKKFEQAHGEVNNYTDFIKRKFKNYASYVAGKMCLVDFVDAQKELEYFMGRGQTLEDLDEDDLRFIFDHADFVDGYGGYADYDKALQAIKDGDFGDVEELEELCQ